MRGASYHVRVAGGGKTTTEAMKQKRRTHSAECKARVALEALKGVKTVNQIEPCSWLVSLAGLACLG